MEPNLIFKEMKYLIFLSLFLSMMSISFLVPKYSVFSLFSN